MTTGFVLTLPAMDSEVCAWSGVNASRVRMWTPTVSLELNIVPPFRNHNSYGRPRRQADLRAAAAEDWGRDPPGFGIRRRGLARASPWPDGWVPCLVGRPGQAWQTRR